MLFHAVNTLHCPIGTTSVHGARVGVGLWGSHGGPKMVKNDFFSKFGPRPLGVLKQVA